jgi:hypothetical protein
MDHATETYSVFSGTTLYPPANLPQLKKNGSRIGLCAHTHNGEQFVRSNICVGLNSELRSLGHFPGSLFVNSLCSTSFQVFMFQIFSTLNSQTWRYGHIHRTGKEILITGTFRAFLSNVPFVTSTE